MIRCFIPAIKAERTGKTERKTKRGGELFNGRRGIRKMRPKSRLITNMPTGYCKKSHFTRNEMCNSFQSGVSFKSCDFFVTPGM